MTRYILSLIFIFPVLLFGQDYEKYNSIGKVYMTKGQLDSAAIYYQKSIDIQPNKSALLNLSTIKIKQGVWGRAIVLAHYIPVYAGNDIEYISKAYFNVGLAEEGLGNITQALMNYHISTSIINDSTALHNISMLKEYLLNHYNPLNFKGEWISYDYELMPGRFKRMTDVEAKKLLNKIYWISKDSISCFGVNYLSKDFEYINFDSLINYFHDYLKISQLLKSNSSKRIICIDTKNDHNFSRFILVNDDLIITGINGDYFFLKHKD